MIPVIDQGGLIPGLLYRGGGISTATQPYQRTLGVSIPFGASLAYVTGSHSAKFGFYNVTAQRTSNVSDNTAHLTYQFNNGVPNQLTQRATPLYRAERQKLDLGVYAQDKWTLSRLTLSYGVRFDHFSTYFPEQTLEPGLLVPTRSLSFPRTPMANWSDIVPRVGAAYDLFGTGKTALKVTVNKYVTAQGLQGPMATPRTRSIGSPTSSIEAGSTRTATTSPDCDLTNVLLQDLRPAGGDLCGTVSDTNFGRSTASLNYDPNVLNGWGSRPYQWEFSTSVQHELRRGVSVDFGYFRRWYGNFGVTDNLNLGPADYGTFSVTAPADPRLPDGGNYTVDGFYNLNPGAVARAPNNYFTLASNYGEQIQHWNGVDLTINARPRRGVTLQGGVSTGRQETDNCAVVAGLPEAAVLTAPVLPSEGQVPDRRETGGHVHGPEGRRADQRAVLQPAGTAAVGQSGDSQCRGESLARPRSVGECRERHGEPREARHDLRRAPQSARSAIHEAVSAQPDASRRESGALQRVEHECGVDGKRHVSRRLARRLARPDVDCAAAVRQAQRAARLLTNRACEEIRRLTQSTQSTQRILWIFSILRRPRRQVDGERRPFSDSGTCVVKSPVS